MRRSSWPGVVPTFEEAAEEVIAFRRGGWTANGRSEKQWRHSMRCHVYPKIGDKPVGEITTADVLGVLMPIWYDKADTARRVRNRIKAVMAWRSSTATGRTTRRATRSHGAVPPVRHQEPLSGPAPQRGEGRAGKDPGVRGVGFDEAGVPFLVLTAGRPGRGSRRWLVGDRPAGQGVGDPRGAHESREKAPGALSDQALAVLRQARSLSTGPGLVFPSRTGKELSNATVSKLAKELELGAVPHGFRSSFRGLVRRHRSGPRGGRGGFGPRGGRRGGRVQAHRFLQPQAPGHGRLGVLFELMQPGAGSAVRLRPGRACRFLSGLRMRLVESSSPQGLCRLSPFDRVGLRCPLSGPVGPFWRLVRWGGLGRLGGLSGWGCGGPLSGPVGWASPRWLDTLFMRLGVVVFVCGVAPILSGVGSRVLSGGAGCCSGAIQAEDLASGLVACREAALVDELSFEGGEKRLADAVAPSSSPPGLLTGASGGAPAQPRSRPRDIGRIQPVVATPGCWREHRCSLRASAGVLQPRGLAWPGVEGVGDGVDLVAGPSR